jgi:hypothetical protein
MYDGVTVVPATPHLTLCYSALSALPAPSSTFDSYLSGMSYISVGETLISCTGTEDFREMLL